MHLGMTVMTGSDAVVSLGSQNLVGFGLTICPSLFLESGLEITPAAAAAEIIGSIGCHVNEIFFTHNRFDNISQFFGNRITERFSDQLAGILNGKFDLSLFVPLRRGFEFSLPDPLGIQLNNTFDFKVMRNLEFLQSGPDCE